MFHKRITLTSAALCILFSLISCANRLDESMVLHVTDKVSPEISVLSPVEGSSYAATVLVTGTVEDHSSSTGDIGSIEQLRYQIIPATIDGGDVQISDDGSFTFSFSAIGFSGPMVVKIIAVDWNGNECEYSLSLADNGAIPSFVVTPGNKKVTFEWDDVAFAESYSLSNLTFGQIRDSVSSGYTWDGLANGELFTFQLQAHSSEGDDNWSDPADAIPLFETTLAPSIRSAYKRLNIEWDGIPTDRYVVSRSLSSDGTFSIRTITLEPSFTDADVEIGQYYYYRIRPESQELILSSPNGALPSPVPPEKFSIVDNVDTPGACLDIVLRGSTAYIADGDSGLRVVDVSDPSYLLVAIRDTPGSAEGVAVEGDYAYIADGGSGIQIVHITNPLYPIVATFDTSGTAHKIVLSADGNTAYVADGDSGLQIINITDPLDPLDGGYRDTPGEGRDVAVSATHAYMADGYEGLQIIDIVNPPYLIVAAYQDFERGWNSLGVDVVGSTAYIAVDTSGLVILDVTDPTVPVELSETYITTRNYGVTVVDNLAFLSCYYKGINIVDVTDPAVPVLLSSRDTPGYTMAAAASETFAFFADDHAGIQVVDISIPAYPIVDSRDTPGTARNVAVTERFALVADYTPGVQFIDVTNPTYPIVGSRATPREVVDVEVSGSIAYALDRVNGLYAINMDDPTFPILGSNDTPGLCYAVELRGSYAYVADWNSGLQILDISDPEMPIIGARVTPAGARDVALSGSYALIAAEGSALQIIDISDPSFPVIVADTPVPGAYPDGFAVGVATSGIYAYFVVDDRFASPPPPTDTGSFHIVNLSNPTFPVVGSCALPDDFPFDVVIAEPYAFVSNSSSGIKVIDISDPTSPVIVDTVPTPNYAAGLTLSGGYLYFVDGDDGLQIVDILTE